MPMDYSHANLCCVLKVEPGCGACKGHAIEILGTIEGVYDVTIDAESKTVKIMGEVNPNHCMKALARCGVHAELVWAKLTHPKMAMMQRRRISSSSSNNYYNHDYDYVYDYGYGEPSAYRRGRSEGGMWHETMGDQVNNIPYYYSSSYNNNRYMNYGEAAPIDYYQQHVDDNGSMSFCSIM